MERIGIRISQGELIVGNRTPGIRSGVVFPEAGVSWLERELNSLPSRPRDSFNVRWEDAAFLRNAIFPYWKGKTLEDAIRAEAGSLIDEIEPVVKINQKDHAQGHICPNTALWLELGPAGLSRRARERLSVSPDEKRDFYESVIITLEAARVFMRRYGALADSMAGVAPETGKICKKLADSPPETFREALQSVWFLFCLLHLESNASSFSPGRMDQYLYPYYIKDIRDGRLHVGEAQRLIEALFVKFNQIVYMRNENSAEYFAGFPIGFNVTIGGQTESGADSTNELSYLFLAAQKKVAMPQPNLSARIHSNTCGDFLAGCVDVIRGGGGMPQIFIDEAVIPSMAGQGIEARHAADYAAVGCVELSSQGNFMGASDAAMFNMVKALELTLNNGRCLLSGKMAGIDAGGLCGYKTYDELENAYAKQLDHFIAKMVKACRKVELAHRRLLPSPFLSAVVDCCLERGTDVTAGGAYYNMTGVQAVQVANVADSLSAVRKAVYEDKTVSPRELLAALQSDFEGREGLRQMLIKCPKYGNDLEFADEAGRKWVGYFAAKAGKHTNTRGGIFHTGLYTVSSHVPMGKKTGATPDGRHAGAPLADGGLSAMCGRDASGPTALLKSVSRIDKAFASNGALLNMKFAPGFFESGENRAKFAAMIRTMADLGIIHAQFNAVSREELTAAQREPDKHRRLTVRVAGYTAYFTDLARDLQDEIIARTVYT